LNTEGDNDKNVFSSYKCNINDTKFIREATLANISGMNVYEMLLVSRLKVNFAKRYFE